VALQSSTSVPAGALTTPVPLTPSASDTFASGSFGATGLLLRVITTGTATNVDVTDVGPTPLGRAGVAAPLAAPATGARMLLVTRAAINPSTDVATITFSGALTGVTYEAYRI
jgi:hypothetical protein